MESTIFVKNPIRCFNGGRPIVERNKKIEHIPRKKTPPGTIRAHSLHTGPAQPHIGPLDKFNLYAI